MTMINETGMPASTPIAAADAAIRIDAARTENVVPLHPLADDQALAQIQDLPVRKINQSALARRWGWSRGRVRRRIAAWKKAGHLAGRKAASRPASRMVTTALAERTTADRIPAIAAAAAAAASVTPSTVEVLPPAPEPSNSPTYPWTRAILILVSIGIAALALFINAQTGFHFGTTPLAAITFMGLSVAADLLAILLPATAAALWHVRRFGLAAGAWLVWTAVAGMAVLASLGFVELHVADTAAGRQAIVTTSTATADQRTAAINGARLALTAATQQREAECQKRGPLCREREADERAALERLNTAIAAPVPTAAKIADADPQVTAALRLTTWAGLKLTADDVVNLRLVLMALLPNLAGLVLAFAMGLAQPRGDR
jgi:hypothetical protein